MINYRFAFKLVLILSVLVLALEIFSGPKNVLAIPAPDGSLVVDDRGTVYFIFWGERLPFRSKEVFFSYGFEFNQVRQAGAKDMALPEGRVMIYRDGSLIKAPDKPLVYIVTMGKKKGFDSAEAFLGLGYSFLSVLTTNPETFQDIPDDGVITRDYIDEGIPHPSGTLFNDNGAIFQVEVNNKVSFSSADVFLSHGYDFNDVVPANAADRALFDDGYVVPRIIFTDEHTPGRPIMITGSTSAIANSPAHFYFLSEDPDTDSVQMRVDWGDGTFSEEKYVVNGFEESFSHIWTMPGNYKMVVRSHDIYYNYSQSEYWIDVLAHH